jgi:hypothetical protein
MTVRTIHFLRICQRRMLPCAQDETSRFWRRDDADSIAKPIRVESPEVSRTILNETAVGSPELDVEWSGCRQMAGASKP